MKRILLFVLLLFLKVSSVNANIVLIDPGHGGEERGAISGLKDQAIVFEKDLALEVARLIKVKLTGAHQVYLTRSYDKTMTLEERALLAQKVGADLFISVHVNSSESMQSNGFETYYLDNTKDEAVKKVVRIENQGARDAEGNDLSDNPVLQQILAELVVEKTVPLSKRLANHLHSSISKKLLKKFGMNDRGIKPGLFYVLAMSKVPGVLLEMGFLSNRGDLSKMNSRDFIETYSEAVANGVKNYFKK